LQIGDSIITSGYSHIFPEGQLIGVVDDFRVEKGGNFYTVDVAFTIDYNKVFNVYVVKSLMRKELQDLEKLEDQN
jgi:rod shape-determining protein MreC